MSKEHYHYQTRGAQKRSTNNAEQQQQKRERESQQQLQTASSKIEQIFEQERQQQQQQAVQNLLMMKSSNGSGASESEENNSNGCGINAATGQLLQKQNSLLSNNSNHSNSQFSMYSGARMDDEDPIFTLDEEVHAKSVERTRHYTADFDPTVSDDDDFQKDLHGGRAYSVSTRFPPRIRHSGRSGHPLQNNTTGIFHQHKLHGQHGAGAGGIGDSGGGGPTIIPASLPIQISRGFNWPPRELVGSLSEEEEISIVGAAIGRTGNQTMNRDRAKTTINPFSAGDIQTGAEAIIVHEQKGSGGHQQQQNGSEREEQEDLYGRMQAYSRSIQPEDDPERIFGERPHRRYSISFKHVHPGFDVNARAGGGDGGDLLLLETSEELGLADGVVVGDPHGEDSIGGENIPPSLLAANANNSNTIIPTMATNANNNIINPMDGTGLTGTAAIGGGGNGGTPRIIVPASLRS